MVSLVLALLLLLVASGEALFWQQLVERAGDIHVNGYVLTTAGAQATVGGLIALQLVGALLLVLRRLRTLRSSRRRDSAAAVPVKVYGAPWCGDCHRSKRLLDRHGVAYEWIDVDQDEQALAHVLKLQNGGRRIPTIVFADGTHLVEPTDPQLAAKLGLVTTVG